MMSLQKSSCLHVNNSISFKGEAEIYPSFHIQPIMHLKCKPSTLLFFFLLYVIRKSMLLNKKNNPQKNQKTHTHLFSSGKKDNGTLNKLSPYG